jgi:tetratricopeptide (TPR) repeat protein
MPIFWYPFGMKSLLFIFEWSPSGKSIPVNPSMDRIQIGKLKGLHPSVLLFLFVAVITFLCLSSPRVLAQPSSVYLRMIVVPDREAAKKVEELLTAGNSFPEIASKYSTDPTKDRGGFLGRVALKDLNEQIRAMVSSIRVGGITRPVRVQDGVAFFQRTTIDFYNDALRLMRTEKFEEALEPLNKDLKLNPDRVHSLTLKAYALQRLNRLDEAKDTYRKIIQREPKNVLAYNNLGTLLDQDGKYADAAKMFEQAVAIDPKQDVTLHNLAWINASRLNNPAKALGFIQKAIQLKPNAANYYAMLSDVYQKQGKRKEARRAMAKAASLEPANDEYRQILAQLKNGSSSGKTKNLAAQQTSASAEVKRQKSAAPPKAATPRSKPAPRTSAAAIDRPAASPKPQSLKIVTHPGGAETSRQVGGLLEQNGFPVALRLQETKPLNGIRVYYKPHSAEAAEKIRDLLTPRPVLKKLTWKSKFDIIVYVGR